MMIFVFGSNLAGVHGAGAARHAYKVRGAQWGVGVGHTGHCYALPTKDQNILTMRLDQIKRYVDQFIEFARTNQQFTFKVTRVGCGLAGLSDRDVAPMFRGAPDNCLFDEAWKPWLPGKKFWGTY